MDKDVDIKRVALEFQNCQDVMTALGDENRQRLVLAMIEHGGAGMRVGEIAEAISLSRPAVSHHLQTLKRAGLITMRKDGTKNYYMFNHDTMAIDSMIIMLQHCRIALHNCDALE